MVIAPIQLDRSGGGAVITRIELSRGRIPPTGFALSWTRLNKAEIRMTGRISPHAKATLAVIRVIFRVARNPRNFAIRRLYLSTAPTESGLRHCSINDATSKYISCKSMIIPLSFE
jgi:hypothetical protein